MVNKFSTYGPRGTAHRGPWGAAPKDLEAEVPCAPVLEVHRYSICWPFFFFNLGDFVPFRPKWAIIPPNTVQNMRFYELMIIWQTVPLIALKQKTRANISRLMSRKWWSYSIPYLRPSQAAAKKPMWSWIKLFFLNISLFQPNKWSPTRCQIGNDCYKDETQWEGARLSHLPFFYTSILNSH